MFFEFMLRSQVMLSEVSYKVYRISVKISRQELGSQIKMNNSNKDWHIIVPILTLVLLLLLLLLELKITSSNDR